MPRNLVKRVAPKPPEKAAAPASLFLFDDRIVWGSASFRGDETTRPACALLIGAERPLTVTAGREVLRTRAVLVAPNVARKLDAQGAGFYSLTLDPAHKGSRYLRDQVLAGRRLLDLGSRMNGAAVRVVRETIRGTTDCAETLRASDWLLAHFFPMAGAAAPIELRVARAASWLRRYTPPRADMRQLGELCQLSAGRLTHLFSQELGVSIRSYLRWVKMCKAADLLGRRHTVTEVAAAIGFADAAHFTRVLRTYYSAAPSFINNRERVRVHACSAFALQA